MITQKNYLAHLNRIGFDKLPEELKKAHLVIMTKTDNGKDWSICKSDKEIKKVCDLAFEKLGEFIASKGKGLSGVSQSKKSEWRFWEEYKIISRFLKLDGKVKTKDEIAQFIAALQQPILKKKIRKTSFFAQEIRYIQEKIIAVHNRMYETTTIRLKEETVEKMKTALGLIEEKNKGKNLNADMQNLSLSGINSSNQIMRSTDFADMKFNTIGFTGKWLELIGDPCRGFTAMIFGKPKLGKSYLAIDMAGYLARNHGKVLYVAREEKLDATLQKKLNDKNVAHINLFVSDHLPEDLSAYDFVFLDSVNKLNLTTKDLDSLKAKNPGKCFVYIFQTTKMGLFRGKNEFQHDVDVVIEVLEKGKAVQFGRFNQGGEMNIFEKEQKKEETAFVPEPLVEGQEDLSGVKKTKAKISPKMEIETEFGLPLEELAIEYFEKKKQLYPTIVDVLDNEPDKVIPAVKRMVEAEVKHVKADVTVEKVEFNEMDSANLSYGAAYFSVWLKGISSELRKVAGDNKLLLYEWTGKSLFGNTKEGDFSYIIDFDERGGFRAHVENPEGKVVYEFAAGNELPEGESSIFEDGFMKHKEDVKGLENYLKQLGILKKSDTLIIAN